MKQISIILMGFLLISSSCRKITGHTNIPVINKSNKPIVIVNTGNSDVKCNNFNPSLTDKIDLGNEAIILPDSIYNNLFSIYNNDWEGFFSYSGRSTRIFIFFFDKDTFYNYPCDTFKKYNWYKKKMELTLDYLNQNNWTIAYP